MNLMSWIIPIASILAILMLLYVATIDVATRLISNEICLALALLGIAGQFAIPMQIAQSMVVAAIFLLLLLVIYARGWMGGGDVKILTVALLWTGVDCALVFAILLFIFASLHALAARFGLTGSAVAGDERRRVAFAPSVAGALIAVFILGCLQPGT